MVLRDGDHHVRLSQWRTDIRESAGGGRHRGANRSVLSGVAGAMWGTVTECAVRRYAGWVGERALVAATYGDWHKGRELTARVIGRGPAAVEQVIALWAEVILSELRMCGGGLEGLGFADLGLGTPSLHWAEQVLAVADQEQSLLPLLIAAVPVEELDVRLGGLLELAVAAIMANDDGFWP